MLNETQKKNLKEESENALEALREARRKYLAKKESREQQTTNGDGPSSTGLVTKQEKQEAGHAE